MLLRCEIAEIAKQLRDVDLRNLIRFKPNPEVLHGIFLKKFMGKLVQKLKIKRSNGSPTSERYRIRIFIHIDLDSVFQRRVTLI